MASFARFLCSIPVRCIHGTSWVPELVFLFSLLFLVELLLPESTRWASLSAHPFWVPVILLSVQYGIGAGLIAALTAIAATMAIGWPDQVVGEDFYDYASRIWFEPMLWLGAAIIVGGLRSVQLRTILELRDQMGDVEEQRKLIGIMCSTLRTRCEGLEREIACARDHSIEAGLSILAELRGSKASDLDHSLGAAMELLLGPVRYSLLINSNGRLSECRGLDQIADTAADSAGKDTLARVPPALEHALVKGRRQLSILREFDCSLLGDTALFAFPILSPRSHRVLGALLIRRMEAARIRPLVEASLYALCQELSLVLSKDEALVVDCASDSTHLELPMKARLCLGAKTTGSETENEQFSILPNGKSLQYAQMPDDHVQSIAQARVS
jgi:hypothetical protein